MQFASSYGQGLTQYNADFLVQEQILTSVQNSITFSSLDGVRDGGYILELMLTPGASGNNAIGLQINGDATVGNYAHQWIFANGGGPGGGTATPNNLVTITNSLTVSPTIRININIYNGVVSFDAVSRGYYGAEFFGLSTARYTPVTSNITSLVLQGYTYSTNTTINSMFGSGTIARLYKKKNPNLSIAQTSQSMQIAEITVSGSAVTSVTFNGLDGNLHGGYILEFHRYNPTGSTTTSLLYFNGDTTSTNYYRGGVFNSGSTAIGFTNTANSAIDANTTVTYSSANVFIGRRPDNKLSAMSYSGYGSVTNLTSLNQTIVHNVTTTNLTSITITSDIADGIGIGSIFKLYRRK